MKDRIDVRNRARAIAALLSGASLIPLTGAAEAQTATPPPPPPYYAPSPYYAPPPTAPPAVAPAPPAVQESPTVIYDWDPDAPAPAGYRRVDRPNGKLIGVGVGLLSSGWVTAMLAGALAAEAEGDEPSDANDTVTAGDWVPMYIPVAGPFVTIGTADARPSVMGLLILDGVVQTAGVLGIVFGVIDRNYKLVRNDVNAGVKLEIQPVVGAGYSGLHATGHF